MPAETRTTLTIRNESSHGIIHVLWNNVSFTTGANSISPGENVTMEVQAGSGFIRFTPESNPLNLRSSHLVIVGEGDRGEFVILGSSIVVDEDNTSSTLDAAVARRATLKINNQSFTEITDVIWNNVSFANTQFGNSILSGTNVTNTVQPGAGFIFFRRRANHIVARTNDMIFVEANTQIIFTFTDDTVIVEVHNQNNNGTLSVLQSTVVWWDDAEGVMQPYHERRNFVGYYASVADLPFLVGQFLIHPPKNGNRSIAVGGTNTAMLHLRVNLTRTARLSFWFANRFIGSAGAIFSINNEEKRRWVHDIDWSFIEFELEPGVTDIRWEKRDGFATSPTRHFFLSLDDILIYYTE